MPFWALCLRAVLFPLEIFYWQMNQHYGYNWQTDVWNIAGCKFSGPSLRYMAQAQGKTYKITQSAGVVTLQLVQPIEKIASHDVSDAMLEAVRNLPMRMRNERDIFATIVNSWIESRTK